MERDWQSSWKGDEKQRRRGAQRVVLLCLLLALTPDLRAASSGSPLKAFCYDGPARPYVPMHHAILQGDHASLQHLTESVLRRGDAEEDASRHLSKALNRAAWLGDREAASMLLRYAADHSLPLEDTMPLHMVVSSREKTEVQKWMPDLDIGLACVSASASPVEMAELLVQGGVDVTDNIKTHGTPLHVAARAGRVEMITWLVEAGAPTDVIDDLGRTPLHLAAISAQQESVDALVELGADPAFVHPESGLTLLHAAARGGLVDLVRELLDQGQDPESVTPNRVTPLLAAAMGGDAATIDLLLERGADARAIDAHGLGLLHCAAYGGATSLVERLLDEGADPDCRSFRAPPPAALAAAGGHADVLALLARRGADLSVRLDAERTPLHLAAMAGQADSMRWLVEQGADPSAKDKWNHDPVGKAMKPDWIGGSLALMETLPQPERRASMDGMGEWLARNLSYGDLATLMDVTGAPPKGSKGSPLFAAIGANRPWVAELLLARGLPAHDRYEGRSYTLEYAAKIGNPEMISLLVEHGADVDHFGWRDDTPLFKAIEHGHMAAADLLLTYGASPVSDTRDKGDRTLMHMAIEENRKDIFQHQLPFLHLLPPPDWRTRSVLATAIVHGRIGMVRELLGRRGETGGLAAGPELLRICAGAGRIELYHELLEAGIGSLAEHGESSLQAAVKDGELEMVRHLHSLGVQLPEDDGYLLQLAITSGDAELVAFLQHQGAAPMDEGRRASAVKEAASRDRQDRIQALLSYIPDPLQRQEALNQALRRVGYPEEPIGEPATISFLLEQGADPNIVDEDGIPPLLNAAQVEDEQLMILLLDAGADPDARTEEGGRTALMPATEADFCQGALRLLERGARTDLVDQDGATVFDIAMENESCCVADLFRRHGLDTGSAPPLVLKRGKRRTRAKPKGLAAHPDWLAYRQHLERAMTRAAKKRYSDLDGQVDPQVVIRPLESLIQAIDWSSLEPHEEAPSPDSLLRALAFLYLEELRMPSNPSKRGRYISLVELETHRGPELYSLDGVGARRYWSPGREALYRDVLTWTSIVGIDCPWLQPLLEHRLETAGSADGEADPQGPGSVEARTAWRRAAAWRRFKEVYEATTGPQIDIGDIWSLQDELTLTATYLPGLFPVGRVPFQQLCDLLAEQPLYALPDRATMSRSPVITGIEENTRDLPSFAHWRSEVASGLEYLDVLQPFLGWLLEAPVKDPWVRKVMLPHFEAVIERTRQARELAAEGKYEVLSEEELAARLEPHIAFVASRSPHGEERP